MNDVSDIMNSLMNSPRDILISSKIISDKDKNHNPEKHLPSIAIAVGVLAQMQFSCLIGMEQVYVKAFLGESYASVVRHVREHPDGFITDKSMESLRPIVNGYKKAVEKRYCLIEKCRPLITFIQECPFCLVVDDRSFQSEAYNFRFAKQIVITEHQSMESLLRDEELLDMAQEKLFRLSDMEEETLPIIAISKTAWEILQRVQATYTQPQEALKTKSNKKVCLLQ
ncbi:MULTISPECIES: hypothetical protein [Parachlamydia]|nr:hypothetical protein [Parachlamydia acanthamoebae]